MSIQKFIILHSSVLLRLFHSFSSISVALIGILYLNHTYEIYKEK